MKDGNVKRASRFHRTLFRLTGGTVGRRLVDNDMLLLTTKGHVTGRDHTVPLLYLVDEAEVVVIASYGGRDHHPSWYWNLVHDPDVTIQIRNRTHRAKARTVGAEERRRLWPLIVAAYSGYAVYQSRTGREIPVVAIKPIISRRQGSPLWRTAPGQKSHRPHRRS